MKFKVGDEIICDCGSCAPIVITKITEQESGYDLIEGNDSTSYDLEVDTKLRLLTPLEKLL
jgi:hypothetical protein